MNVILRDVKILLLFACSFVPRPDVYDHSETRLHDRAVRGRRAAATRRPSSVSKLYVEQAFH